MTFQVDRRSILLTGAFGMGAFAVPGFGRAMSVADMTGFTHSVASGEPSATSMLLWTRYVPADGSAAKLRVEMSESADFASVAGGGEMITGPWRDHTAKITVTGLKPGTAYHYRFIAPDGGMSPVGQTKTLPEGEAAKFGIAVFSCSNLPFGYFNAYGHAAARDDIDLWVHLGDYLYEYKKGGYAPAGGAVGGRWPAPDGELLALADYRLRYASYRSDPDLQKLHAVKPMIVSMDDHESANDSWEGGAQNHQPEEEGDWSTRKMAALQAWREWMPISDDPWAYYSIGTLATLFRTDTRLLARSEPHELAPLFMAASPAQALAEFRDGAWQDTAATMMGTTQEAWLDKEMRHSIRHGAKWQIVGFGTIMGNLQAPQNILDWLAPDAPARTKAYFQAGAVAAQAGLPFNLDNWGGYPAARARFLKSAQEMDAELIVLCGDSHNAWAFDLAQDGAPAGVEFAGHSVSSPGIESATSADPAAIARSLVDTNPELKWCDTSRRGYMALTLTPEKATNDWIFVDSITTHDPAAARIGYSASVTRGAKVMG
ncbi:alkaline phosphatase D family protein [Stakelama tenebrarum]|uniref:Alkaline phosphatase D family protein n=1 Tax=Stakelama tenebrarum TaxID=2711215 RepID=A0A6G6Y089_9SPHN|nr:alkaline phosphatase D family protein [Sphingosinithalassobacter tenebrarum]QIG78335.1 alkaline phosphatase D family protein [Sphingosinithalassobacter tenebrarum]